MQSARTLIEDGPEETSLSTIWELVCVTASGNILDDPDMPEECLRQEKAHQVVHDILTRHTDIIDGEMQDATKEFIDAVGNIPECDIDLLRAGTPWFDHSAHHAICTVLELAAQVFDMDNPEHATLSRAIDIMATSWVLKGYEICSKLDDMSPDP